jgi:hypothetical protein
LRLAPDHPGRRKRNPGTIFEVAMNQPDNKSLTQCRFWIAVFIGGLVLSGITAIPIEWELRILAQWFGVLDPDATAQSGMGEWIGRVYHTLKDLQATQPFVFYAFDWLAFGHVMIALAMLGVWQDPIRNRWLFTFGKLACVLVIPWAFAFGALRGIPIPWRLIDCSFGVLGLIPLYLAERAVSRPFAMQESPSSGE